MLGKPQGGNVRLRCCERGAGAGAACKTNGRRELAYSSPRPRTERERPHSSTPAPERPGAWGGARSTPRPPNRQLNLTELPARLLFSPRPPTLARPYPTPVHLFTLACRPRASGVVIVHFLTSCQSICGLVAMTSASHAQGREFDPSQM